MQCSYLLLFHHVIRHWRRFYDLDLYHYDSWSDTGLSRAVYLIIIIIGIIHDSVCSNICWAPREVLKPKPERRGFQQLPRGQAVPRKRCWNLSLKMEGFNISRARSPADVNVSENHVWSLLVHKNMSLENLGENALKSFLFLYLYWCRKARYLWMFWKHRFQGK